MNFKKVLSFFVVALLLTSIQFIPGSLNSSTEAASPDKIGIYTNSFGYYVYVTEIGRAHV